MTMDRPAQTPNSAGTSSPAPFTVVASVLKSKSQDSEIDIDLLKKLKESTGKIEKDNGARLNPVPGLELMVLDDVLSIPECEYLIKRSEEMGYSFWDSRQGEKNKEFRNADTIEIIQPDLADLLWSRISSIIEPVVIGSEEDGQERWERDLQGEWDPIGTNNDILFVRYVNGGHFSPHTDGYSIVDCDERSMYTLLIFLNDCEEGGGTRFYEARQRDKLAKDENGRYSGQPELAIATVEPKAGRAVIFYHQILHEGVPVGKDASKYIIRSDVMYKRRNPICKTDADKEAFDLYQKAQQVSVEGHMEEAMRLFRKAFKMSPTLADVYGM